MKKPIAPHRHASSENKPLSPREYARQEWQDAIDRCLQPIRLMYQKILGKGKNR